MKPALAKFPPSMRKELLDAAADARKKGAWGLWEEFELLNGAGPTGWPREMTKAYRNKVFCVLRRDCREAIHFAVSSLSGIRPTWHEMQRIKNELAGADATGIEVYPPASEVVDDADMLRLCIVKPLPFSMWADGGRERNSSTKQ